MTAKRRVAQVPRSRRCSCRLSRAAIESKAAVWGRGAKLIPLLTFACALALASVPATASAYVYWFEYRDGGARRDNVSISRAHNDGSAINADYIGGLSMPMGLTVDGSHLIWSWGSTGIGERDCGLGFASLDASSIRQTPFPVNVRESLGGPSTYHGCPSGGLAVAGGALYWEVAGRSNQGGIGISGLTGENPNPDLVADGPEPGWGHRLATDGTYLYASKSNSIRRWKLDGSPAGADIPGFGTSSSLFHVPLTPIPKSDPRQAEIYITAIAVDGAHIYFATTHGIGRANLDGSNMQLGLIPAQPLVTALAVHGGYIYWGRCATTSPSIYRSTIDGGTTIPFLPATCPKALAVDDRTDIPSAGGRLTAEKPEVSRTAAINAALDVSLRQTRTVSRSRFLRTRKATLGFVAPVPGRLTIRWLAGKRVVATGQRRATAPAQRLRVQVRLKPAARRLLPNRRRLRAVATFAPGAGYAHRRTRTIRLVR